MRFWKKITSSMPISLADSINKKSKDMVEEEVKAFFMALEQRGIKEVRIPYDGSGDSGSTEEANFITTDGDEIDLEEFENVADKIANHILDKYYDVDWYNNDGGHGVITINIIEKTWEIDGYYREMQSIEAPESGDLKDVISTFEK
jgi:hypothetical protein